MTPRKDRINPNPDRPEFRYKSTPPHIAKQTYVMRRFWSEKFKRMLREQIAYNPHHGFMTKRRMLPYMFDDHVTAEGVITAADKAGAWNVRHAGETAIVVHRESGVPMIHIRNNSRGRIKYVRADEVAYYLMTGRVTTKPVKSRDGSKCNLKWSNIKP